MAQSQSIIEFPSKLTEKEVGRSGIAALQELRERRHRSDSEPVADMEKLEQEMHALFVAEEHEALGPELARLDINERAIEIGRALFRQVERCGETDFGAAGPVQMKLRAGIVEGRWSPLAAKQATWVVAHLTPGEGEELFDRLGNMTPSKSSLDRLLKQVSSKWEAQREEFEAALRKHEAAPREAVAMAVSLDGVMLRIEDSKAGGVQYNSVPRKPGANHCGREEGEDRGEGSLETTYGEGKEEGPQPDADGALSVSDLHSPHREPIHPPSFPASTAAKLSLHPPRPFPLLSPRPPLQC